MQLNSATINRAWKIGTLWSTIVLLVLLIILNHQTQHISSLLAALSEFHLPTIVVGNSNHKETLGTEPKKKCNISDGRWVYDPNHFPSYDETKCRSIISPSSLCRDNGRPDSDYLKWKWEAKDCDIPMLNGTDMLERLRNKRMIFVGDSLNSNQWEALVCLLYSSISPDRAELRYGLFKSKDYNCTVEFQFTPFLIELDKTHKSGRRVLVVDKIANSSEKWRGADIMVFNSCHWWTHSGSIQSWDAYEYKGQIIDEMPREIAFERGMITWTRWLENNVDPKKTTVVFRSYSDAHFGKHWCNNSTQPLLDLESFESRFPNWFIDVAERLIKGITKLQVKFLNVTKLTQYRRDAHQSKYANQDWKNGTSNYYDCSHWCVPGVPDTWNRLLYASIFFYD